MIERVRIASPLLLVLFSLLGCKSVKYIPVEVVRTDTCLINKIKLDSVYCKDSIYVERVGESITTYKYKYLYRYIDRHDTVYIHKIDTITKVVTVKNYSDNAKPTTHFFVTILRAVGSISLLYMVCKYAFSKF